MQSPKEDTPEKIVEGCFKAQERIVSGYKGNEKASWKKYQEALRPKQVAISLTGEPTLYGPLGDLISLFYQKGLTTFLVTNGNLPAKLSKLSREPTQLYVSLCAPNEEVFNKVCRPQFPKAWKKLHQKQVLLTHRADWAHRERWEHRGHLVQWGHQGHPEYPPVGHCW
jgi:tRNA wybutosine-synthesizing protein 1